MEGCTDRNGAYALPIGPSDFGENLLTFHGPTFNPVSGAATNSCDPTAVDPTPGLLSGQYPTIPNKPIYINAGMDNGFRDMPLPERDLTGSQDLSQGGVATDLGGNAWTLNQEVEVRNAGVKLGVPAGCTATFPANENPVLSITRVPPDRLPVPMPPGLSSSLFVTYQPGDTEITCPVGVELFTEFDNDDEFPVGPGNLTDGPFLAGITNGVFTPLVACEVLPGGTTVHCGPIPLPFDFARYHTDIQRLPPCPRTTVVGQVIDVSNSGNPVAGASVAVPGAVPVLTDALGQFSIPNVPAGPNGPGCFTNPFSIRASGSKDLDGSGTLQSDEFGVSMLALAIPGGLTNVLDIRLGLAGGAVQGRVLKLSSVDPFVVTPLPDATIGFANPSVGSGMSTTTDNSGNYSFPDVPQGPYEILADFSGELPVPGGGSEFKNLFDQLSGDIDFAGKIEVKDFRFTSTGAVQVTVVDESGAPVPNVLVILNSLGGPLGGGFVAPVVSCFGFDEGDGMVTLPSNNFSCSGVPQGPCEFTVFDGSFGGALARVGPDEGCFVNQHGELVELTVELPLVTPPPFGNLFGTNASGGALLNINISNGSASIQAFIGLPVPALAIDPSTRILYAGVRFGFGIPGVFTLDPISGFLIPVGDSGLGVAAIGGLDFCPDGTLFASVNVVGTGGGSDHLATIDPTTGAAALIGPFGNCDINVILPSDGTGFCDLQGMEALVCDDNGNLLGATTERGAPGQVGLWDIDKTTGTATFRIALQGPGPQGPGGAPSGGISSLEHCDGILFGGTAREIGGAGDGGRLITINKDTGAFNFVEPFAATSEGELGGGFGPSLGGLAGLDGCTSSLIVE